MATQSAGLVDINLIAGREVCGRQSRRQVIVNFEAHDTPVPYPAHGCPLILTGKLTGLDVPPLDDAAHHDHVAVGEVPSLGRNQCDAVRLASHERAKRLVTAHDATVRRHQLAVVVNEPEHSLDIAGVICAVVIPDDVQGRCCRHEATLSAHV